MRRIIIITQNATRQFLAKIKKKSRRRRILLRDVRYRYYAHLVCTGPCGARETLRIFLATRTHARIVIVESFYFVTNLAKRTHTYTHTLLIVVRRGRHACITRIKETCACINVFFFPRNYYYRRRRRRCCCRYYCCYCYYRVRV